MQQQQQYHQPHPHPHPHDEPAQPQQAEPLPPRSLAPLEALPDVLVHCVALFLTPAETCAGLGAASTALRASTHSEQLWRRLAEQRGWRGTRGRAAFVSKAALLARLGTHAVARPAAAERGGIVGLYVPPRRRLFRWDRAASAVRSARDEVNRDTLVVTRSAPYGAWVYDTAHGSGRGGLVDSSRALTWSAVDVHESRMVFSPSGSTQVMCSDLAEPLAAPRAMLPAHTNTVTSVRIARSGRYAASGSYDRSSHVYDVSAGCTVGRIAVDTAVWAVDVRDDGRYAAAGENSGLVTVWEVGAADPAATAVRLPGHDGTVMGLRFDPSAPGRLLYSCSYDGTVRLWDYVERRLLRVMRGHSGIVVALTVTEHVVLSGSRDRTAIVWDKDTGERLRTLEGPHTADIRGVEMLENGDIVTGGLDGDLVFWRFSGWPRAAADMQQSCAVM